MVSIARGDARHQQSVFEVSISPRLWCVGILLGQTLYGTVFSTLVGGSSAVLSLFVKTVGFSYFQKADKFLFGVAKLGLQEVGGIIPSIFSNTIGILNPSSVHQRRTLSDSGKRGFLSAPLIRLYENYMTRYRENYEDFLRDPQAAKDCTLLQKIVSKMEYVATYAVAPRLAAVAMLVAVTVTRVLDLGIGCVFAPFALLLAPLELDEFNEITFEALQGLTLVYDYFLLLHNLLCPGGIDEKVEYTINDDDAVPGSGEGVTEIYVNTCWDSDPIDLGQASGSQEA